MSKRLIITLASTLTFALPAIAQSPTTNPLTYGFWEFATSNGFTGEVVLSERHCQYSISSSFSHVNASCSAYWDENLKLLNIVGDRTTANLTVPDYQPDRKIAVAAGGGLPRYSFSLKRVKRNSMSGHLIGAGEHVDVKLLRH